MSVAAERALARIANVEAVCLAPVAVAASGMG